MDAFLNYKKQLCFMSPEQAAHIPERHPEATSELISKCLSDPIELGRSTSSQISYLYYILKDSKMLFCVVLQECVNENFIFTAYTTNKMKRGETIYKKED